MLHNPKIKIKFLCVLLAALALLALAGCADDDTYTPPPAETQKQDKTYESQYNSSRPVRDTWEGEDCISLTASIHVLRMEDEFISHVEISADETLLGVVAYGRSLPVRTVNGERIFTLTPNKTEATRLNDGTSFYAQLYFKGDTVPSVRVRRVFNTHTETSEGVPNPNMEAQRLLKTEEIQALNALPEIDALPDALHFASEVRYFPETGAYKAHYGENRWMTATPSDGTFEKNMQYEMEHSYYTDIRCYTDRGVDYYIIEGWPTGPDVSEEEHTFSIRWEKDGLVYDLYLIRAITSHEAAHEVIQNIRY